MQAQALGADSALGHRPFYRQSYDKHEVGNELPSFKPLVDRRRCIIPADGFYEWRKEGRRKVPMWVYLKSRDRLVWLACGTCGESRTGAALSLLRSLLQSL